MYTIHLGKTCTVFTRFFWLKIIGISPRFIYMELSFFVIKLDPHSLTLPKICAHYGYHKHLWFDIRYFHFLNSHVKSCAEMFKGSIRPPVRPYWMALGLNPWFFSSRRCHLVNATWRLTSLEAHCVTRWWFNWEKGGLIRCIQNERVIKTWDVNQTLTSFYSLRTYKH